MSPAVGSTVISELTDTVRLGDFEIAVDFGAARNVLRVRGEIDLSTAPSLRAALLTLVDQHPDVVLDLAQLEFMDASGIGVIVDISSRLRSSNRILTVRSAPARALWLLQFTGVHRLVRIEVSDQDTGVEQRAGDRSRADRRLPSDLAADLARVGAPADPDAIDAVLRLVTVLAAATVSGADGVSVTLERNGQMTTVAASNETVLRMDQHHYETGEGPCLAAAAVGHPFHIESLADEARWKAFVPRAIDEGIASILSTPLMTDERPIGALNIYSNTERTFGPEQQALAGLFATLASEILANAGADSAREQMSTDLASAVSARETIAQAQGVIMERHHLNAGDAAVALYRAARTAETTVLAHAGDVTASRQSRRKTERLRPRHV